MVDMTHLFCIIFVRIIAKYLAIFVRITQRVQDVIETLTWASGGSHDWFLWQGKGQGKKTNRLMKDCCCHNFIHYSKLKFDVKRRNIKCFQTLLTLFYSLTSSAEFCLLAVLFRAKWAFNWCFNIVTYRNVNSVLC